MTVLLDLLAGIGNGSALLLVLVFMLRGSFRKYPLIFAFALWELLGNVALSAMDLYYNGSAEGVTFATETAGQRLYARVYFANDVATDLFQLLLVITLIYSALPDNIPRKPLRRLLTGMAIIAIVSPFVLFHPKFTGPGASAWYHSTGQFLNFGAAVMNLVLWSVLIASKKRDPVFLKVSAGLGIVVTGAAISYGLLHFIPPGPYRSFPNIFLLITQLAGWIVWCAAFRPAPEKKPAVAAGAV